MKTLQMIKSKDPRIYDSNYPLYAAEEEEGTIMYLFITLFILLFVD